ncbi:hypothetical protein BH23GEM10_BH23GEM10_02820 [soil metagenome]
MTSGGLLIPVSSGRAPVAIDLGVRYHSNGEVEYLERGELRHSNCGTQHSNCGTRTAALMKRHS